MEDERQHAPEDGIQMLNIDRTETTLGSHLEPMISHSSDQTVSIPPELLAHIFNFHASSCMPIIDANLENIVRAKANIYCWLSVLEVCRRWYIVAIQTPTLWTTIHFPLIPAFVDICLRRSQSLPLTVSYNEFLRAGSVKELKTALAHMHRIRHLEMEMLPQTWVQIRELVHRAPKEVLRSFFCSTYYTISDKASLLSFIGAHSLQRLRLTGRIRFDGLETLSGLKELSLRGVILQPVSMTVSSLLHALGNMPALTSLCLVDMAFVPESAGLLQTVRATHLTTLYLEDIHPVTSVAEFLDHFVTSGHTQLVFAYHASPGDTTNNLRLMFTSPLQRMKRTAGTQHIDMPPPTLSLCIKSMSTCMRITGFRTIRDPNAIMSGAAFPSDGTFLLELPIPSRDADFLVNLMEHQAGEAFEDVRCLCLMGGHIETTASALARLSSTMPNVDTLALAAKYLAHEPDLRKLLVGPARLGDGPSQTPLPWPNTTRLVLYGIMFNVCECEEHWPPSGCVEALRDVLLYRRARGCALLHTIFIEIPLVLTEAHVEEVLSGCAEVVDVVIAATGVSAIDY